MGRCGAFLYFNARSRGAPLISCASGGTVSLQPPLARGARSTSRLSLSFVPSTPARAGRPRPCWSLKIFNPRSRGAPGVHDHWRRQAYLQPPLARGARDDLGQGRYVSTATPARAGRPTRLVELFTAVAFNPRSRGAPVQTLITVRLWHLQPPLARGARVGQALTACPAPSTPARAGRPFNHLMRCVGLTFNPRSRGAPDKIAEIAFAQILQPPLARGALFREIAIPSIPYGAGGNLPPLRTATSWMPKCSTGADGC